MKIEGDKLNIYQKNNNTIINELELIESIKITYDNPRIKLHPYKSKRFYLEIYQYETNKTNNTYSLNKDDNYLNKDDKEDENDIDLLNLRETIKSKFHFETETKQSREVIYILLQYIKMESKIKTNKILQNINNKEEYNCNFEDLLNEIKATQEENSVLLTSSKIKSREIELLKKEMSSLEEDFMN